MDYHFHPETGELLGASPLEKSPLEPGVYLHPAHSTAVAPPDVGNGEVAVFDGGAWSLAPDHRGETWYRADGREVIVSEIGAPADDGLSSIPIMKPPTSDDVNSEAARRIASGFTFQGKRYDYDDKAQKRITGAATLAGFAAGAGSPEGYLLWHGGADPFVWISMDNSLVEMDAQTCFAFGQAAAAHESAHVFAARALKDAGGGVPADFAADSYWP